MTITATTAAAVEALQPTPVPAQETVESPRAGRPARRTFTAEYKRRIVAEYDQAPAGEKGRVLRREGLYDSSVKQWRAQIEAGTLGRVSKKKPRAGLSPEQARIAELEKQIGKLETDAARKDEVIADRDAALEVMGKGVAFLEALSKKNTR
ncbi:MULTISPECIES: transposase [Dietzia]|jgi:transposase-like protein|uniref:transposase n=1 Tax=Dietzia TaxID=37914 RepID=UPI0008048C18|nr:transposase [Dietzia sp. 111N12-1]MBC7296402.1 transposase [Dietzia sp.]OAV76933.1 transposase [Dietzia sp. 111N12-1]